MLTVKEYAELYRLHIHTVYVLLRQNKISGAKRIGRSWRLPS